MGSIPGRAKRLESVISICILGVLILTGVGIFVKQSDYDMSRFGISTSAVETTVTKSEIPSKFGDIIPAGFESLSEPETYDSETLYEKIDGKAPLYLESGFKELTTQRFISPTEPELWMEVYVYDMGDIKNAFSVYSVQKRTDAEAVSSMRFGYKTSNAMYFVHGRYYIEIVGSLESEELSNAIAEVAQKIGANLAAGSNTSIAELAFFPQRNIVTGSIKLYLKSAFGCEKLTDIFTARYKLDGESVTAFASRRADAKAAKTTAESYREFLIENGAVMKNTTNAIFTGKVIDLFGATEIVFTTGPFVGGIHEAESQQAAEKVAEELINRLNEFVRASNNE